MPRSKSIPGADVTVAAYDDGVPMFCASVDGLRDVYLYQREDCAWLPVFPADGRAIAKPDHRHSADLPAIVAGLFPDLVKRRRVS